MAAPRRERRTLVKCTGYRYSATMARLETIPLVATAFAYGQRTAVVSPEGPFSYSDLLERSHRAALHLLAGREDLRGARVAFLITPSMAHVVTQWACFRAGGVAVPLCVMHPAPELAHVLDDSGAEIVVADSALFDRVAPLAAERGLRLLSTDDLNAPAPAGQLPQVAAERDAMLIYTSGTTGKPKGAMSTHAVLAAQIRSVATAWQWRHDDHILHVLPLHHLHGILNVLCCALWSGARCELLPAFDAELVWDRIADADGLSLFMGVPTIYQKLIAAYDAADPDRRTRIEAGCRRLRLMVSGSAALPVPTLQRFREISGHTLLERYGMTEIGMALGNPLDGERRPGHVGVPFPGVQVRLVDERGQAPEDGQPGRIEVRGANVFTGYYRRPEATREVFTQDGWFKTGDVAVRSQGSYRILGRESVDILKTGGFKVSALEIEAVLRAHPAIEDCAVVGVPDPEWGQRVAAAVVLSDGASLSLDTLRSWGKTQLAVYKVPSLLRTVDALPRNPLGKVTKPDVVAMFTPPSQPHGPASEHAGVVS